MYFSYVAVIATLVTQGFPKGINNFKVEKLNNTQESGPRVGKIKGKFAAESSYGKQELNNDSESQPHDYAYYGVKIQDIEDLEEQIDLALERVKSPEVDQGPLIDLGSAASRKEETKTEDEDLDSRLVRIADYLSKEHLSIGNFKPSVSVIM